LKRKAHKGELLPAPLFAERLGGSSLDSSAAVVFSLNVEGTPYYPEVLASPPHDERHAAKLAQWYRRRA
jgi:hypothetical protein